MNDEDLDEQLEPPVPGPCGACGRSPALGYASVFSEGVETWYCHPDEGLSCYSGDVA